MRLTLRTMLAYMDEILEPEDAEDIGKKIEESELARTVMQRTRDALRRMRLGAPPVEGRGLAQDANTVAEYLDNTLAPEQVPDFERICLESEVHLAEVGASHQILTLVLGEPADVDPISRDRMYGLISEAGSAQPVAAAPLASPAIEAPPVESAADLAAAHPAIRRTKPEVPDYLREPSRSGRSLGKLALAAVVLLVVGGVLAATFVPEIREQVATLLGSQADQEPAVNDRPGRGAPDDADSADMVGPADSGESPEDAGNVPPDGPPTATDESRVSNLNQPPNLTIPRNKADEGPDAPDPDMTTDVDPNAPPVPDEDMPVSIPPAPPADPGFDTVPPDAVPAVPPAEEPIGEALGRYLYKQDVLLRYDRRSDLWRRLPAMASLSAGDKLMALPVFRPTISLSTGVTIQPVDASVFEILGMDETGVPTIAVDHGRILLFTAGKPRNQIRVRFGDRQGTITFADGESTMALEVRRTPVPGKDPTIEGEPLAVDFYATSGEITWEELGALSLKAPAHQALTGAASEPTRGDLPRWTHGEPISASDQRGSIEFEKHVTTDKPVSLTLKELLDDRRFEVRGYATRAAAYMGDFEPFVTALNDPVQKASWPSQIETLKAALVRGPDTAKMVLAALVKHRGADAPELFRMLWGYTPDQLSGGEAARLVEYLNHDSLDYRVLAFNNLREITGKGLNYQPQYPAAKRSKEYRSWKERLKEGKVVPANAVPAAPPPRPAAPKAGARARVAPGPKA